jgi:hypothetical protein
MAISNVLLGSSETTIKAAGVAEEIAVLSITFVNNDTTARNLTVYAYPSSGSASTTTKIIDSLPIAASDTFVWTTNERFILNNGDKISGLADVANKINATANYIGGF